jgi:hypothetical protein
MPSMRRKVQVQLDVEFDDTGVPTPDVDEAVTDAVSNVRKLLIVMPSLKGVSSRGRKVVFKVKDLELA